MANITFEGSQTLIDHTAKFMNLAFQYAFNFESDFISKSGITPFEHMQLKFNAMYTQYGPTYGFVRFWSECDAENRIALMTYIMKHYATAEELLNDGENEPV